MYLDEILSAQKHGQARGIASICSAHPLVLETAMRETLKVFAQHPRNEEQGAETFRVLLIEATCNQVNQFGGYTGMTPVDFVRYVGDLAERVGFPRGRLLLGGDHLGPGPWQHELAAIAMGKAKVLVRAYVLAGFSKIHLDASMRLGDDPPGPLPVEVAAERAAELAKAAEESLPSPLGREGGGEGGLRYVIGTEVPIAGGAQGKEEKPRATALPDLTESLDRSRAAFLSRGLESAWERVVAVVVQPGVEYGADFIWEYDRAAAAALSRFIESQPLIYEAHSTDYQTGPALRQMVEDHFAILKVGPALTFALREAFFALAHMENELFPAEQRSNLIEVLEAAMLANPAHWQQHYRGDERAQALARKFSFSDRARYYWPVPAVQAACERLLANLGGRVLPLALLSQYLPGPYARVRAGEIPNSPRDLIRARVGEVLQDYAAACGQRGGQRV